MSDHDRRFFDVFMIVLGALVLFTIGIYFLAQHVQARTQTVWMDEEREQSSSLEERIAPIGQVAVTGETPPPAAATGAAPAEAAPAAGAEAAPAAAMSGEEVYNAVCFACHAVGVAGAPKLGDAADWGKRAEQGNDVLYKHAMEGFTGEKGMMPPRGGSANLTDEEVKAAVDHMVAKSK